jgi:broad specificity phosphatase PhoE
MEESRPRRWRRCSRTKASRASSRARCARAHETALPLAARLGLPVHTTEGWAEADRHLGRYRSTETLHAQGPAEWQRFLDDPLRYLGVEPERFIGGVLAAYRRLIVEGPSDAHVAVYTHGLPINIVLSHILGLEGIVHFDPATVRSHGCTRVTNSAWHRQRQRKRAPCVAASPSAMTSSIGDEPDPRGARSRTT